MSRTINRLLLTTRNQRQTPEQHLLHYLVLALLVLALTAVHVDQFKQRSYRMDEVRRVSLALNKTQVETLPFMVEHVITHPPLWQLFANAWVRTVGHFEVITRWFSTLLSVLGLAVMYRLAADLFGRRVGLLAVLSLGVLPTYAFYSQEFRPYAALILIALLTQLTFLRWLRRPDFPRALLFVVVSIAALYTHFFAAYLPLALGLFFIIYVRYSKGMYLRAFGLYVAIGLSFLGWLLPFLHSVLVLQPGGVNYRLPTNLESLLRIERDMQVLPPLLGRGLMLVGLVALVVLLRPSPAHWERTRFRFPRYWRLGYSLGVGVTVLAIALVVNLVVDNVTLRNLSVLLPSLALVLAAGLAVLPRLLRGLAVGVLVAAFATTFVEYEPNYKFQAVSEYLAPRYDPGTPVVVDARYMPIHIAMQYYIRERNAQDIPNHDLFHLMSDNPFFVRMPDRPVHRGHQGSADELDAMRVFLDTAERVWYVRVNPDVDHGESFVDMIETDYVAFHVEPKMADSSVTITEFRRIPADLTDLFRFGDALLLQKWTLLEDVTVAACDSVTFESWWRAATPPPVNYSMALVLVGADGVGVTRSDGAPSVVLPQQWLPDRVYLDRRALTVPCDLPPGEYPLLLSIDDPTRTPPALDITTPDGAPLGTQVYLTTLFVE